MRLLTRLLGFAAEVQASGTDQQASSPDRRPLAGTPRAHGMRAGALTP